jgi:hypothetical protein
LTGILKKTVHPEYRGIVEFYSSLDKCDYFIPIITEGYRRRIEPINRSRDGSGKSEDGWVFDEAQAAAMLSLKGHIKFISIWRSGPVVPHFPVSSVPVLDFRNDELYDETMSKFFPTVKVLIVGMRSNRTGRLIGPILRSDIKNFIQEFTGNKDFVEVRILDHFYQPDEA